MSNFLAIAIPIQNVQAGVKDFNPKSKITQPKNLLLQTV
jgi:hypothetical protein